MYEIIYAISTPPRRIHHLLCATWSLNPPGRNYLLAGFSKVLFRLISLVLGYFLVRFFTVSRRTSPFPVVIFVWLVVISRTVSSRRRLLSAGRPWRQFIVDSLLGCILVLTWGPWNLWRHVSFVYFFLGRRCLLILLVVNCHPGRIAYNNEGCYKCRVDGLHMQTWLFLFS